MIVGEASSTLFRLIVIVAVSVSVPSSASTVRLKIGVDSKFNAALLATVISPVDALIINAPPVLPPVIL